MTFQPLPKEPLPLRSFMVWLESLQRSRQQLLRPREEQNHVKFEVQRLSALMIEQVWQAIEARRMAYPEVCGLGAIEEDQLIPLSPAYIAEDMQRVWNRSREFPISRLRAWSTRVAEFTCQDLLGGKSPRLLSDERTEIREAYLQYSQLLGESNAYWFRRTPNEHVGTGFHTALSAFYRMLGAAPVALWSACASSDLELRSATQQVLEDRDLLLQLSDQFCELAQYVATAHFDMLPVLDGTVWDSSGSTSPQQFLLKVIDGKLTPCVSLPAIENIVSRAAGAPWVSPPEPRTGCPALHARAGGASSVIRSLRRWCEETVQRWYWPLVLGTKSK